MILVGGENLIDLVQGQDQSGKPAYVANPGGSPYNCAIAMARQGLRVGYLTPVSEDSLGGLLAERLEADGVAMLGGRRPEPTSLAVVSVHNSIPTYAFYRENTAERQITPDLLSRLTSKDATGLHIGSLALTDGADAEAWEGWFRENAAAGRLASLDPNVRPALIPDREAYTARIFRMMGDATVLKLSDEDLEYLFPNADLAAALPLLADRSKAALTVVTKGAEGAIAWTASGRVEVPATRAEPLADTVGAGDTFSGTLITELSERGAMDRTAISALNADDLAAILGNAAKAAAINCTRDGCDPPSRAEVLAV